MQEQEDWVCPVHPETMLEWDGYSHICASCVLSDRIERMWESVELPPLEELVANVDDAITEYLWIGNNGPLITLFLYFHSEKKPLDPREFLEFWGPLSPAEEDYYIAASAEAMRDEAKGGVNADRHGCV